MLLRVKQVYNNNAVLVDVGNGKEAILQGRGIGFSKRKGDQIDPKKSSEILYLNDAQVKNHFTSLLKDVPIDIVVATFGVIGMAKRTYHYPVLNYIYVTLTDHVFQMYKRLTAGKYQASPAPDIRDRYPLAYQIAIEAVKRLNHDLGVHFPDTEVKNIALHFINAKGVDGDLDPTVTLTARVNTIVTQVFAKYGLKRSLTNQNYFDRLMIHLQYLVERLNTDEQDEADLDPKIGQDFKRLYPKSFAIAMEICTELEKALQIKLNENEHVYFIIHIQRLIQEPQTPAPQDS
ncbi:PRD domain-containing protein [Lacticaseibacillus zeae]|uniref:PRD domain-containing protein n=1 Tax=Lacticaseibacillus zeae TaxID=57037 RepID=A0A5R8LIS6_LACZE|nr:PRD domain-containing protein [Lacticaseibacillus zeae]TLF37117.1 PRD domain-containing protein [Lacticaseibacillus zeae]